MTTVAPKKKLYAIAVEMPIRGRWVPEISYVHAEDAAQARFIYLQGNPPRGTRIVGVALAVGYFVEDKYGDKLSLD